MILSTMTPEEKVRQMEHIKYRVLDAGSSWIHRNMKKFLRTKIFPTFYSTEADFSDINMGKWTIIIIAESKANIKKGIACIKAYQTYHVMHAKNPSNNGTGIYAFNASDDGVVTCYEYPPHYFNRFRERMVEEKGIVQPEFPQLVKMMYREQFFSMDVTIKGFKLRKDKDGKYLLVKNDNIDRQEGYDNLICYHPSGISLGVSGANRRYFLMTTYVSNSMLHQEQIEKQKEQLRIHREYEYMCRKNPFATYNTKKWEVDEAYQRREERNKNKRFKT